jgi:AcrR family transcriptional regulator
MRVKTDAQRDAVLRAAGEVFREEGYERASMSRVAKRLGGSKGTLYSYFSSKEELFAAAMLASVREVAFSAFHVLETADTNTAIADVLTEFGAAYIRFVLGEEVLELTRLAIAEGRTSAWGPRLYEQSVQAGWQMVIGFLQNRLHADQLPAGGVEEVAVQYRGLLVGDILVKRLRGVIGGLSDADARQIARSAASVILRCYGDNHSAL